MVMKTSPPEKRGRGRRPAGIGSNGQPEKTSQYPKLTIAMRPEVKSQLEAVAMLTKAPAWRIIETALQTHLHGLPIEDQKAIEGMVSRMRTQA